jgi:hypothetical protein
MKWMIGCEYVSAIQNDDSSWRTGESQRARALSSGPPVIQSQFNYFCFIRLRLCCVASGCGRAGERGGPGTRQGRIRQRGGRGNWETASKGGCYCSSMALKIYLIKTWVSLKLSSTAYWKWHFWWKPLKQKSLLRYFARHFWFLKNICFNYPRVILIFTKKAFLNSQAVRIRVKGFQISI